MEPRKSERWKEENTEGLIRGAGKKEEVRKDDAEKPKGG